MFYIWSTAMIYKKGTKFNIYLVNIPKFYVLSDDTWIEYPSRVNNPGWISHLMRDDSNIPSFSLVTLATHTYILSSFILICLLAKKLKCNAFQVHLKQTAPLEKKIMQIFRLFWQFQTMRPLSKWVWIV